MLYEKAPAKINLTLDVLHKRPDGFHEVEMVMTTVDLADRLSFKEIEENKIVIQTSNHFIPNDHRNLAYQAAQLIKKTYRISKGVQIVIEKSIPAAAGLAGGSTDAAATLRGLNRLWKLNASLDELARLGAKIGSDIPFCVYGGTALATGRGERIEPLPSPPNCWVILAKPSISISTANIYGNFHLDRAEHPDTKSMIKALQTGDYKKMCQTLGNSLESVSLNLYPEVQKLKEQMLKFGADAALMSGSGPTIFGLVKNEARVSRIYNGLKGFCPEVYAIRMMGN